MNESIYAFGRARPFLRIRRCSIRIRGCFEMPEERLHSIIDSDLDFELGICCFRRRWETVEGLEMTHEFQGALDLRAADKARPSRGAAGISGRRFGPDAEPEFGGPVSRSFDLDDKATQNVRPNIGRHSGRAKRLRLHITQPDAVIGRAQAIAAILDRLHSASTTGGGRQHDPGDVDGGVFRARRKNSRWKTWSEIYGGQSSTAMFNVAQVFGT